MKQQICININMKAGKKRKKFNCCAMGDIDKMDSHTKVKKFVEKMISNCECKG